MLYICYIYTVLLFLLLYFIMTCTLHTSLYRSNETSACKYYLAENISIDENKFCIELL